MVVDIEVTDKLGGKSKRGVALVSIHYNEHNSVIFAPEFQILCGRA